MMTKEEMLTQVVRKFGFEHHVTINFATLMDDTPEKDLQYLCGIVLAMPLGGDDDEEDGE